MGVHVKEVKFSVDGLEDQEKFLNGKIKVGIAKDFGILLNQCVYINDDIEFQANKLPNEIQLKLVEVYKDIQKYFDENLKI